VNELAVTEAPSIDSENVTLTVVLTGTLAASAAGVLPVTAGGVVSPGSVVSDPHDHAASKRVASAASRKAGHRDADGLRGGTMRASERG
jgi:hypothetical protein